MKGETKLPAVCGGAILILILLSWLVNVEAERLEHAAKYRHGLEIERGALLYDSNCRTCHGSKGEGIGQLGPPLSDKHFFTERVKEVGWQSSLEDYVTASTRHGRMMGTRPIYAGNGSTAVMPAWSQAYGGPLRPDEILSISSFVMNWRETALGTVVLEALELPKTNPGDPQVIKRGEQVFRRSCNGCHAHLALAATEFSGPDLSHIAETAAARKEGMDGPEYIRESILIPGEYVVPGYEKEAADKSCGAVLTETELGAVTAFLQKQ